MRKDKFISPFGIEQALCLKKGGDKLFRKNVEGDYVDKQAYDEFAYPHIFLE